MKVIIAGGSGQVGTILSRAFHAAGHETIVLSRHPQPAPWRVLPWDGETQGPWGSEFENADVVINLAGRSVNCRYGPTNRRIIMESRVNSTRVIGEAIARTACPPRLWLQASTATIYAHRYDAPNDEVDGILGGDEPNLPDTWVFSLGIANAWERTFHEADTPQTRKVLLRSAIVMSPDRGGAFDVFLRLTRLGLGGRAGNGRQFVSWIHDEDFIRAVFWLIEHPELDGVVNLSAPHPLPNADFMRALRRAWGIGFGLPAWKWMIEVGTFFLRTESELVLKSRRVISRRLPESGFKFHYSTWDKAAQDLCNRVRKKRPATKISPTTQAVESC
jgi:uncharacterized protein (TIGR01777 family)